MGTATSIGLLALLLAVRYSSDSVLTDAGGDVAIAIRLIDLFTVVAFGMLVATMGQQMAANDNAKLAFKYTMTFSLLAPATIFIYIFRSGWMIYGIGIILLAVITVYGFKIRPWIIIESFHIYRTEMKNIGACSIFLRCKKGQREK